MPWQQYLPESSFLVALRSIKWEHPSQQASLTTRGFSPPAVQLVMHAMDVHHVQLEHGKTTLVLPLLFHAHLELQLVLPAVSKNRLVYSVIWVTLHKMVRVS